MRVRGTRRRGLRGGSDAMMSGNKAAQRRINADLPLFGARKEQSSTRTDQLRGALVAHELGQDFDA